jgi:O-antigen/teichoic acid export membrane protein
VSSLKLQKISTKRWLTAASHVLNKLLTPAFSVIISLLIVRSHGSELWGEFVFYSLIANFSLILISWGHQEYLIKNFSQQPGKVANDWSQSLNTRVLLYLVSAAVVMAMPLPFKDRLAILAWTLTLFIYRSFDVLILYNRDFKISTVTEATGHLVLVIIVLLYEDLSVYNFIIFHSVVTTFKIFGIAFFYRKKISNPFKGGFSWALLIGSFPFFLPSLVGFVQSRIDMYIIAFSLTKTELAKYQIFITLLSLIHQVGLLTIAPYTKNIYRLADARINSFAKTFFIAGSIASFLAMPVIYGLITFYYRADMLLQDYLLGAFTLMPLFYYSIKTYQWFKHHAQYKVVVVNCIMAAATLFLGLILIPKFGITGGLIANCAGQWTALAMFYFMKFKKTAA